MALVWFGDGHFWWHFCIPFQLKHNYLELYILCESEDNTTIFICSVNTETVSYPRRVLLKGGK